MPTKLFAQSLFSEARYGPGEPLSCRALLGCSRSPVRPVLLSPASPKPGETNTVTPRWQVPLGSIQFPRETSTHRAHVPSRPTTEDQAIHTMLATTAVPSLWFGTTITVQGKGYSALVLIALSYWSGGGKERGCRGKGQWVLVL